MTRIEPRVFIDVAPADLRGQRQPDFDVVDPRILNVDHAYQRSADTLRSTTAIKRILSGWRWSKFKVITCVRVDGELHVIDGQHTAIAAASHPDISAVPILIVDEPELADRARAFVSHARDRLAATPGQVWKAEVAAGDEEAVRVQRVCQAAGVILLPYSPPAAAYKPRETIALAAIKGLIRRRGPEQAAAVLAALADGELAPLTADAIKAAEALLCDPEYAVEMDVERVAAAFRLLGSKANAEAKEIMVAKGLPLWRALTAVIFKHRRTRAPAVSVASAVLLPTRRVIDRTPPGGPVHLGEPGPGRSALDQRKAAS